MADENADSILDNALGIKRASGDTGSMEQHSIPHQIAADRHRRSVSASKLAFGARHIKLRPPSAADVEISNPPSNDPI